MEFELKLKHILAINAVFRQYPAKQTVIVYGSRAKGNYKNGSDIDLTLLEEELSFSEFLEIENKLDDLLLPYKIDLPQKRKISDPELLNHIDRVGQIFYKKTK